MLQTVLTIVIAGVISNNMVLVQGWGICPFLGVSKKQKSGLEMGMAVIFVLTIASLICSILANTILTKITIGGTKFDFSYLQMVVFILVIASLVQFLEVIIKKFLPALYSSLGIYLPLITTNCAVLRTAQNNANGGVGVIESTFTGFAIGVGFLLALVLMGGIREKLEKNDIPKPLHGFAIALMTASIIALVFVGLGTIKF